MIWMSKQPTQAGWYVYRENASAEPEVVHFWWAGGGHQAGEARYGSTAGWPPNYGFGKGRTLLLAKRMHTDPCFVEEGLGGQYLCNATTHQPEPVALELLHGVTVEQPEKPKRKKKASKKKIIELSPLETGEKEEG